MRLTHPLPAGAGRTSLRQAPLFTLALLAFFMASSTLRGQTPNPVLDLKFDEGTGTTAADSSGNNNNATLLGSAGWTTGTVGPFALSESGIPGSYADISTDVVDTTKSFTVAAWVKLTTLPGYQTFVSEDGVNVGGNAQSAFFLQKRDDTQQFSFTVPYDFFTLPQSGFTPVVGTGTIWPGFTMRTHNPRLSMLTASWPT